MGEEIAGPSPEPEPQVDPETFGQCKEMMRPVMKKIIAFGDYTDQGKVEVSAM